MYQYNKCFHRYSNALVNIFINNNNNNIIQINKVNYGKKLKSQPPNYFFCVRLSNDQVILIDFIIILFIINNN